MFVRKRGTGAKVREGMERDGWKVQDLRMPQPDTRASTRKRRCRLFGASLLHGRVTSSISCCRVCHRILLRLSLVER